MSWIELLFPLTIAIGITALGAFFWTGAYSSLLDDVDSRGRRFGTLYWGVGFILLFGSIELGAVGAPELLTSVLSAVAVVLVATGVISSVFLPLTLMPKWYRDAVESYRASQSMEQQPSLRLEPWNESGLDLLRLCNSPEMTAYLGGPESEQKLQDRHHRYLSLTVSGHGGWPFLLTWDGEAVGSVGYWEDEEYYEMGWAIAPLYQGLGFARDSVALMLAHAAANGTRSTVHALPSIDNAASNAVASSVGFTYLGQRRIEYPVGHFMVANDWVYDLAKLQSSAN